MKKFYDGGEYFTLSAYKITSVPYKSICTETDINPATIICRDAYYLSSNGKGECALEFIRIGGKHTGKEVQHIFCVRTHDISEKECVMRQEAVLSGMIASLKQNKYEIEEISYEQYCRTTSRKSKVWAIRKQEIVDYGLHNTYISMPVYDSVKINWGSIYAALDGSGCVLSIQVIPSSYTNEERQTVLKNTVTCAQATEGLAPAPNMKDPFALEAKDRWNYYASRLNQPAADINITISGGNDSVNTALLVARFRQSLSGMPVESILLEKCNTFSIYNQPWMIANSLKDRKKFSKCSIEEAGGLMQFPYIDDFFIGVKVNPYSAIPEKALLAKHLVEPSSQSLSLGLSVHSNQNIYLPYDQLVLHTAILGKSGTGKTTLLKQMISQLYDSKVSVLIIEPVKREYRDLIAGLSGTKLFTIERPYVPFLLNPFEVPEGVALSDYRSSLLSAFKAAFSLPDPLPSLFEKAISEAYTQYGWTDMSRIGDKSVTLFDMTDFLRVFKRIVLTSGYGKDTKGNVVSGGVFRLQSLLTRCPNTFDTLHSTREKDVINGCTVLEMGTLEPEQKSLVTALTLIRLLAYLKATRKSTNKLQNIILIDEIHALLDSGQGVTQEELSVNIAMEKLLINIITEMRAYGVGVILSDQSPSRVGSCILDNVENLLAFRLTGEEAGIMKCHMGAEDNVESCLPLMSAGHFVLKNQYLQEPLGIYMPKLWVEEKHYSDMDLVFKQRDYLEEHKRDYCPFAECRNCPCCNVTIRAEAHMYATKIFNERCEKIQNVESLAEHLVRIPFVMKECYHSSEDIQNKFNQCTAIHLLRLCSLEKGITLSEDAVSKLLHDMVSQNNTREEKMHG